MKQSIESEQLKELTPNQFRKLCVLVGDKYYYNSSDEQVLKSFQKESLTMYISILQKTNIGQMIEILCNTDFGFPRIGLIESRIRSEYIVTYVTCLNGSKYHGKSFESDNLCDALWMTVKFMLDEMEKESRLIFYSL